MKLTQQQINTIQSLADDFKVASGIRNYDEQALISRLENLRFDLPEVSEGDEVSSITFEIFENFSSLYKTELKENVIPSAIKIDNDINEGLRDNINGAFEWFMSKIYDKIIPDNVKAELEKIDIEYEPNAGMTDEEYNRFIGNIFENHKDIYVGEAMYVGDYKEDEKKKEAQKKSPIKYVYKTRKEEREADLDYRAADKLSDYIKPTKDYCNKLKDYVSGKAKMPEDLKTEVSNKYVGEIDYIANQYMLVREKYNHLNFFQKWFTPKGLALGGAMRDTRAVFKDMNALNEKLFGTKLTENVSESLHEFAKNEKDYLGENEFEKITNRFKIEIPSEELGMDDSVDYDEDEWSDNEPELDEIVDNTKNSIN